MTKAKKTTYAELANMQGLRVDLARRHLFIYGEIDQEEACKTLDAIYALECDGAGLVRLWLYSCGGTVVSGLAIYDALTTADFPVHTRVYGEALSIAVPILQAAEHREMTPNSRLLLHKISYTSGEEEMTREKLRAQDRELESSARQYEDILIKRSGVGRRTIQKWCAEETYFSATRALEVGLIDAVVACRR